MSREFPVKQNDFRRLIGREEFLSEYFDVRLRYRVPSNDNDLIYVEVLGAEQTENENAEQYIRSFLDAKHTISINTSSRLNEIFSNKTFLNRLMKEYLVHIEIENQTNSHRISFQSSTVMILYLAIDDFQKEISQNKVNDSIFFADLKKKLKSLSDAFERELSLVDEQNQFNDERKILRSIDDEEFDPKKLRSTQEPSVTIAFPGAKSQARQSNLEEFVKTDHRKSKKKSKRSTTTTDDQNDNELAKELRQKLKEKSLRTVVMDGANIGRTFGRDEFSSRGIQIAVDHFQLLGYPDSKIIVIVPAHYLSKDSDGVFQGLMRRKILHTAFHQKIEDERKRFYDDRLIVDIAVVRKGVILSNDFYRDLSRDSGDAVRKAIRERLLCYRFVGDDLFLPNPVFEGGARLEDFLSL